MTEAQHFSKKSHRHFAELLRRSILSRNTSCKTRPRHKCHCWVAECTACGSFNHSPISLFATSSSESLRYYTPSRFTRVYGRVCRTTSTAFSGVKMSKLFDFFRVSELLVPWRTSQEAPLCSSLLVRPQAILHAKLIVNNPASVYSNCP
jgi:hypothetical protein